MSKLIPPTCAACLTAFDVRHNALIKLTETGLNFFATFETDVAS